MGLLMANTVYDKINLRTRFVAVINRGGGTSICWDARYRSGGYFVKLSYKNMVGIPPQW